MDYERMWKQLKTEILTQEDLSDNINISKLLNRIIQIEDVEKEAEKRWKNGDLPF